MNVGCLWNDTDWREAKYWEKNFEVRHPRCVGSIANNFCVLNNEVEHNYISSSITQGLQPEDGPHIGPKYVVVVLV